MALARSRQAARRVKDRWKAKQWYKVVAPIAFNNHVLAETLADDPAKLEGRRVEATLQELTGDFKQMHVKLNFKVAEVSGNQAKTVFDGHAHTSDYVRRLTRRGAGKVSAVFDVKTKDGSRVRVKPFAITDRRAQTTKMQEIRRIMKDRIETAAAEQNLSAFLADVLVGDLTNRIYKDARKIHPVRRVEIAKTEMLTAPAIEVDETPLIKPAEPEPEPAEDEGAAVSDESEGDTDGVVADVGGEEE